MNRLIEIQDEEGQIQKQWIYNQAGHLEQEMDANGNATYYTYDLLGNVLEVWKPIEEQNFKILYQVTLYEYDKNSNKIKEKRGLDKVKKGEYPKRYHELSFVYDALQRLITVLDRYGAKTVYRYDCLNQKIYESFQINKDTKKMIH